MEPILCGVETEYGLYVEGRGAENQVQDSQALVRSYPGERLEVWDSRFESPRRDLRGFALDRLAYDPEDAKFDEGRALGPDSEVRADRVLPNGARFYNDHGHPEYATPECNDAFECALHDRAGQHAVLRTAEAYSRETGRRVRIYKNNTDFHGASYGTHESYLVPRTVGWETLYRAVAPMLVARQILCGAGKVGSESGPPCNFQISQRADFFTEPLNAETLFRRPVFNTRDEPHANPERWIRLHVISGDANMMLAATARKLALAKLAIQLAIAGRAPEWALRNPVAAFQSVSRDESRRYAIALESGGTATAYEILESYFEAADAAGWFTLSSSLGGERPRDPYLAPFAELAVAAECVDLLSMLRDGDPTLDRHVDWAAKRAMLESYRAAEGVEWAHPMLRSFDLEYTNVDPDEGLFWALAEMGEVDDAPMPPEAVEGWLSANATQTRSEIRSAAVRLFPDSIATLSWGTITFRTERGEQTVELPPDWRGSPPGAALNSVESFIEWIRGLP